MLSQGSWACIFKAHTIWQNINFSWMRLHFFYSSKAKDHDTWECKSIFQPNLDTTNAYQEVQWVNSIPVYGNASWQTGFFLQLLRAYIRQDLRVMPFASFIWGAQRCQGMPRLLAKGNLRLVKWECWNSMSFSKRSRH